MDLGFGELGVVEKTRRKHQIYAENSDRSQGHQDGFHRLEFLGVCLGIYSGYSGRGMREKNRNDEMRSWRLLDSAFGDSSAQEMPKRGDQGRVTTRI